MSSPPIADAAALPTLDGLRGELDLVDDAIHDLVMRRAELSGRVAALGTKGRVPLRPGREAAILRRLLARHRGRLPAVTITRVWRELISASTALQRPLLIAVCEGRDGADFAAATREHFGALVPLHVHRTPAQAINEVSAGLATAAVLPLPAEDETPGAAWWTALLHKDEPRIHIVARLPFWTPRPEGAPRAQAQVVSTVPPDPSGSDRSLIGLELPLEVSRARLGSALMSAELTAAHVILRRDPGAPVAHALVDVTGFVTDDDPRLARISSVLRRPVVLGAYAVPIEPRPGRPGPADPGPTVARMVDPAHGDAR